MDEFGFEERYIWLVVGTTSVDHALEIRLNVASP